MGFTSWVKSVFALKERPAKAKVAEEIKPVVMEKEPEKVPEQLPPPPPVIIVPEIAVQPAPVIDIPKSTEQVWPFVEARQEIVVEPQVVKKPRKPRKSRK